MARAVRPSASQPTGPDDDGADTADRSYSRSQWAALVLGPSLFALTLIFFRFEGLDFAARAVLATTLWMATWWIGECLPLPVTALLPVVVFPLVGALETDAVFSAFGDNIIFLFMGGFFIALALEKWNLHKRIALAIVRAVGTSVQRLVLGFILATGFVSVWITNTATAMMMIPMGIALITQLREMVRTDDEDRVDLVKFEKALIFGIGYAATISGVGTLIGGTTIPIFVAQSEALLDVEVTFAQYLLFGVPFVLTFLLVLWLYLTKVKFRMRFRQLPTGDDVIATESAKLGKMSREEKYVAMVGGLVAFLWVFRTWLIDPIVVNISDGMIAVLGAALLFLLPAVGEHGRTRVLVWDDANRIPWGILLLFGGGLALSAAYSETGLSAWIASQFELLESVPWVLVVALLVLALVFITEFTSITATAVLFVPLVGTGASAMGQDPLLLMLAAALAVNCAFMLPVATPPNAILYSSGAVTSRELMRAGVWLSLTGALLISLFVILWGPIVFSR